MACRIGPEQVASIMLAWHGLELVSCKKIKSLWAGYGHICQITARPTTPEAARQIQNAHHIRPSGASGDETFAMILKLISPPPVALDSEDEGHLRKMLSYEVEQHFYTALAPHLADSAAHVAGCIASTGEMAGKAGAEILDGLTAMILTDLKPAYPIAGDRRAEIGDRQVYAALDWLANFHGASWRLMPVHLDTLLQPPLLEARRRASGDSAGTRVWLNGGYAYLATRRTEYAGLVTDRGSEWSRLLCQPMTPGGPSIAEMAATFLTPRGGKYETLIHGDVKWENMFTTRAGDQAAFFDFQYVGLGHGVCDLASFLTCYVPLHMLVSEHIASSERPMADGEKALLERYRSTLLNLTILAGLDKEYEWDTFVRSWETALVNWLRFLASWGFWGNTDWIEARVRSILKDQGWRDWLQENQDHAVQSEFPIGHQR